MKAENLARLGERAPHIRRLLTWNADENGPMIAVNEAFGFRTVRADRELAEVPGLTVGTRSRWQRGQRCEERFMNGSRTMGVPQRGHGRPSRP